MPDLILRTIDEIQIAEQGFKMRFFVLLFFLIFMAFPSTASFDLLRTIGNDVNDDYMFFKITGAVMSDQKDIFVIDEKGLCVSKYNWDGVFQKRVGQSGRGPKDFLSLQQLRYFDNRIHIRDWKNYRIASADTDLENFEYFQLKNPQFEDKQLFKLIRKYFFLDKNRLLLITTISDKDTNSLCIINKSEKSLEKIFHNYIPVEKSILKINGMAMAFVAPIVGINYKWKKILVTSGFAENSIKFFLYTFTGELIKESTHKQEKNFVYPIELFNKPVREMKRLKEKIDFSGIDSIHSIGDYFLVVFHEYYSVDMFGREFGQNLKSFILVLDKDANFIYKEKIPDSLYIYYVSQDGYVLARGPLDEDIQKVRIYRLELKK